MSDSHRDRLVPTLLAAVALLGAYNHQPSLVAVATTLLVTFLLTRFWSGHSLHAVRYQRETNDDRAFPGDELLLTLRLANHKLLPLPWVEVDDTIPQPLRPIREDGEPLLGVENDRLRLAGSVGWYERLQWHYRLRCRRRGIYRLGPATITSGDPFGLFPRSSSIDSTKRVVVYPRLLPPEQLGLPAGFPLGQRKPEKWIFEDPSRPAGVRDYRREDPFHHIHWKATARRQQLQVKLHEPTTTLETAIFLGVDTFEDGGTGRQGDGETGGRADGGTEGRGDMGTRRRGEGWDPERSELSTQNPELRTQTSATTFEYAVSVVATLAHQLIGRKHPTGLYLNGGAAGSLDPAALAPGASQEHLIQILELLAGVEPLSSGPVELLLAETVPRLPWGAGAILVVADVSEPLAAALENLGGTGRKPMVFLIAEETSPRLPEGVLVRRLRPAPGLGDPLVDSVEIIGAGDR